MESIERWPNQQSDAAPAGSDEQSRLTEAMLKADDLLLSSLKQDETRRKKRRLILAGVSMFAALIVLGSLLLQSPGEATSAPQLTQKGWQLWQKHDFTDATDAFEQALKLDPKLANAWNGLGWSQFNGGSPDSAIDSFEHVLKLAPNHPAALNGLGQIYFLKGKFDKAEPYLLKAAPQSSAAWWALTKMYLLQGKWTDAEKYAQKVLSSNEATGPDLEDAKAMLQAAKDQNLPEDLKKKISPPEASDSAK